jgi:hypothetical protein
LLASRRGSFFLNELTLSNPGRLCSPAQIAMFRRAINSGRIISDGALSGRSTMVKHIMSMNNDVAKTTAAKLNVPAAKQKKATGRTGKLKSCLWYQGAARSIGISTRRSLERD